MELTILIGVAIVIFGFILGISIHDFLIGSALMILTGLAIIGWISLDTFVNKTLSIGIHIAIVAAFAIPLIGVLGYLGLGKK